MLPQFPIAHFRHYAALLAKNVEPERLKEAASVRDVKLRCERNSAALVINVCGRCYEYLACDKCDEAVLPGAWGEEESVLLVAAEVEGAAGGPGVRHGEREQGHQDLRSGDVCVGE